MNSTDFRKFMIDNGYSYASLATLLRANPRTLKRWAAGQDIPYLAQVAIVHLTKCA